jgi:hypothetical protein
MLLPSLLPQITPMRVWMLKTAPPYLAACVWAAATGAATARDALQKCLQARVDPAAADEHGWTALHYCCLPPFWLDGAADLLRKDPTLACQT